MVKEFDFVDLIISRGRLIVKEFGVVDPIVSRGRLIVTEIGVVDLYLFLFIP